MKKFLFLLPVIFIISCENQQSYIYKSLEETRLRFAFQRGVNCALMHISGSVGNISFEKYLKEMEDKCITDINKHDQLQNN